MIRNHVGGYFKEDESLQRFFYYPETYAPGQGWAHWLPTLWLDGIEDVMELYVDVYQTWAVYKAGISSHLSLPSPLTMDFQVEYGDKADTGMVYVEVVATDQVVYSDLHLRLAIIESGINYGARIYNQVLRDYLPDQNGIFFTMAQGDTFTHSQEFLIQSGWEETNCAIVAFVQNDTDRMLLQAVQGPVLAPTPVVSETSVIGLPRCYRLDQNYPNPFNASTEICYQTSQYGQVTLKIFNNLGQEVRSLVDAEQKAGQHAITWDGRDNLGRDVASGIFFCRLKAGDFSRTIKMVLLR